MCVGLSAKVVRVADGTAVVDASGAVILDARDLPYGDYLIITSEALSGAFEPLAAFKTAMGFAPKLGQEQLIHRAAKTNIHDANFIF